MKFMMTKEYMEELKIKYCEGVTDYVGAYAMMGGFLLFNFAPPVFALFVNQSSIRVVVLGQLTLNAKKSFMIEKTEIESIKTRKGLLYSSVKIKTKQGKKHNFKIQNRVIGLIEDNKKAFEILSNY